MQRIILLLALLCAPSMQATNATPGSSVATFAPQPLPSPVPLAPQPSSEATDEDIYRQMLSELPEDAVNRGLADHLGGRPATWGRNNPLTRAALARASDQFNADGDPQAPLVGDEPSKNTFSGLGIPAAELNSAASPSQSAQGSDAGAPEDDSSGSDASDSDDDADIIYSQISRSTETQATQWFNTGKRPVDPIDEDDEKGGYAAAVAAAVNQPAQPANEAPAPAGKSDGIKKIEAGLRQRASEKNISDAAASMEAQPDLVTPHFPPMGTSTGSPSNMAAALAAIGEGVHQANEVDMTHKRLEELRKQKDEAKGKSPAGEQPESASFLSKKPLYALAGACCAGACLLGAEYAGYDMLAIDLSGMLVRMKYRLMLAFDRLSAEEIQEEIDQRTQALHDQALTEKKRASLVKDIQLLQAALIKALKEHGA